MVMAAHMYMIVLKVTRTLADASVALRVAAALGGARAVQVVRARVGRAAAGRELRDDGAAGEAGDARCPRVTVGVRYRTFVAVLAADGLRVEAVAVAAAAVVAERAAGERGGVERPLGRRRRARTGRDGAVAHRD